MPSRYVGNHPVDYAEFRLGALGRRATVDIWSTTDRGVTHIGQYFPIFFFLHSNFPLFAFICFTYGKWYEGFFKLSSTRHEPCYSDTSYKESFPIE